MQKHSNVSTITDQFIQLRNMSVSSPRTSQLPSNKTVNAEKLITLEKWWRCAH